MTEETDAPSRKPDGSAYAAHLAAVTERNTAAKKAGKARRTERELAQTKRSIEIERAQEAGMRKSH